MSLILGKAGSYLVHCLPGGPTGALHFPLNFPLNASITPIVAKGIILILIERKNIF